MTRSQPGKKTICLNFFSEKEYHQCLEDREKFKQHLGYMHQHCPELFPLNFSEGWICYGMRDSKKIGIGLRRIQVKSDGEVYQVRPSFLMPYMIGKTTQVEKGLYAYHAGCSFEAVTYLFKKNPMYWYRAFTHLGYSSMVSTTIKEGSKLPPHLLADEKHTWCWGEKVYLATTVGGGCILGAALAEDASEAALTRAYGEFKEEAQALQADYEPTSVNTDIVPFMGMAGKERKMPGRTYFPKPFRCCVFYTVS